MNTIVQFQRFGQAYLFSRSKIRRASLWIFSVSFSNRSNDDKDEDDCPLCRKYSKGPCGSFFQEWKRCSEQNENYVEDCATQFQKFQECVDQHEEEYSGLQQEMIDWEKVVTEDLAGLPVEPFPERLVPQVKRRGDDLTLRFRAKGLVFAFTRKNGKLLYAGQKTDFLLVKDTALAVVPNDSKDVSAVYEEKENDVRVFTSNIDDL